MSVVDVWARLAGVRGMAGEREEVREAGHRNAGEEESNPCMSPYPVS